MRNLPVRRQKPDKPVSWLPFHQDGHTYPDTLPHLKAWTLIEPDHTGAAPGLELLLGKDVSLMERAENPSVSHYGFLESSQERLEESKAALEKVIPEVRRGDVLLFDGNMIHRTHVTREMSAQRIASEVVMTGNTPEAREYYQSFSMPVFSLDENGITGPVDISWASGESVIGRLAEPSVFERFISVF